MSTKEEKTGYEEQMKNTCINVLKSLGYEVELKERPKMPEPFLKKGDEFWYVNECPLQVINATVVAVGWETTEKVPCLEVVFETAPVQPYGSKIRSSYHILESEMGKFYFRNPQGALARAQKILEENNTKQGELYQ